MQHLYTPWRMNYIKGNRKTTDGGCVFCQKNTDEDNPVQVALHDAEHFVVARSEHVYVTLNIFPYSNGHLMVVPYEHINTQEHMSPGALTDLMMMVNRGMGALRKLYNPAAFNLGANIGDAAGAGIAAHYHFHIVPRWAGDANFMSVVGETRIIPDTLENTYRDLKNAWEALYGDTQ